MTRATLRRQRPLLFEILAVAAVIWAAKCLLLPPSNFAKFPCSYRLSVDVIHTERNGGLCGLFAAILYGAGLAMLLWRPLWGLSGLFRAFGLTMGGFLLLVLGVSFLACDADSLPSGVMLAASAACLLAVYLWPATPDGA